MKLEKILYAGRGCVDVSAWKECLRQAIEDCRRKARTEVPSLWKRQQKGNGGQMEHSRQMYILDRRSEMCKINPAVPREKLHHVWPILVRQPGFQILAMRYLLANWEL